jgi:hypothetical protein
LRTCLSDDQRNPQHDHVYIWMDWKEPAVR